MAADGDFDFASDCTLADHMSDSADADSPLFQYDTDTALSTDDTVTTLSTDDQSDHDFNNMAQQGLPYRTRPLIPSQPDYTNNNPTAARRSRSPTRDRDNNNNYRDQRSPANNYDRSDRRPSRSEQPQGNMEDRQNSQQDRRVYVGNLSYDVKWHHLKDHMREGISDPPLHHTTFLPAANIPHSWTGPLRRRPRAPERNEQG